MPVDFPFRRQPDQPAVGKEIGLQIDLCGRTGGVEEAKPECELRDAAAARSETGSRVDDGHLPPSASQCVCDSAAGQACPHDEGFPTLARVL